MDIDPALKKHKLRLDLAALDAELEKLIGFSSSSPALDEAVCKDLIAARELVQSAIAKILMRSLPIARV